MACSGILAPTVGLLVLISLTNGQTDINRPKPACDSRDMAAGIYTMPHPDIVDAFIQCSNNNQEEKACAAATAYDTNINQCNHVYQTVSSIAPCSPGTNTMGRNYRAKCCEDYFRCNGEILQAMKCPAGQVFNTQSGQCGQGTCIDHVTCSRNQPPSGIQKPCPMVPDPSNPCNFQWNINGTLLASQPCAEGSRFDVSACSCITDANCMRKTNISGSYTLDSQCRADFLVTFQSFQPGTNNPQVFSEKTGTPTPHYVQAVGVSYGTGEATMNSNPQTGALAFFYVPYYSSKQVTNNFIAEFVIRANLAGPFEIFSNNYNGACVATFSINGTYNGNGGYQVSGFVTGVTPTTFNQQQTNTAQISATINVGSTDHVLIRIFFTGRVSLQLGNRGPTGTGMGQIVNAQESGVVGEKLAHNKCGFQLFRGFSGVVKRIAFREGCLNPDSQRT